MPKIPIVYLVDCLLILDLFSVLKKKKTNIGEVAFVMSQMTLAVGLYIAFQRSCLVIERDQFAWGYTWSLVNLRNTIKRKKVLK
jgi:hypothetical protein